MQTLVTGVFGLIFIMLGFTLVGLFLAGVDWFLFDGKVLPKVKEKFKKCAVFNFYIKETIK